MKKVIIDVYIRTVYYINIIERKEANEVDAVEDKSVIIAGGIEDEKIKKNCVYSSDGNSIKIKKSEYCKDNSLYKM